MTLHTGSSGNLTADRRFDMAQQFIERGDLEAAADLMDQALELAPSWAEGRFVLAETLMRAGHTEPAVSAFQTYLTLDPADSMGAQAKLAQLGLASVTAELPRAYVERLFDQYAPRFDKALVEGLKYSAPQQIRAGVLQRFPQRRFAACLDLGCGTGLMGAALRDVVKYLEGVDLSAGMVAEAKRKNIYDALAHMDLLAALQRAAHAYDLIVAADVLVYVGDLAPIMTAAKAALKPGGLLAFTVQAATTGDYRLGPDQRFSHGEAYIRSTLSGFVNTAVTSSSFRRERHEDVPGLLVLVENRA